MAAGPFPPLAACLQWAIFVGIDLFYGRWKRGLSVFTNAERLIVLAVWLISNTVAGRGMVHPLLASLVGPAYYARGAAAASALAQNIPDWLAVTDKTAVRQFYEGYNAPVPWKLWFLPLLTWSLFFVPFILANICMCALFERVWVRNERLAFPLVALPLNLMSPGGSNEKDRLFKRSAIFGMSLPILLHGFGIAHAYIPVVPCIPFYNDISDMLRSPPWNVLNPLYINIYPILIGFTLLSPTDITLSVWFFLALNKIETLMSALSGWNDGASGSVSAQAPFLEEQSAGAFIALAAILVWNARHHLTGIAYTSLCFLRSASSKQPINVSQHNPKNLQNDFEYRSCTPMFYGCFLGIVGVIGWCWWIGFPVWFSIAYFGFFLIVALVLSRLMAEGGISWLLAPILPDKLILSLTGSSALSSIALTRLSMHVQHLRDARQILAPSVFQGGKLRDSTGFSLKSFYVLSLAAVVLTLVVGVGSSLPIFYHYGALTLAPNSDGLQMSAVVIPTTGINQLSGRLLSPIKPSLSAGLGVLGGAAATLVLSSLRLRFVGWPLHPLGYALTGTLQLGYANKMFISIFAGWLLKSLILRYGGVVGFRILRGVALGLILSDLIMGVLLKLLDAILGPSGYAIF